MLESSIERLAKSAVEPMLSRNGAVGKDAAKAVERGAKGIASARAGGKAIAADKLALETRSKAELAVMDAPTSRNQITLHVSPEASNRALLDSIKHAKSSFYIETFIWHNDAAGNAVIDALGDRIKQAKAEGKPFDAKVLIDWFGLRQGTGGTGDKLIVDKLRAVGVDVQEFAKGYFVDGKIIPITHQKLYIQDGAQFMTGGRNIGDEYLHGTFTDPKGGVQNSWHDLLYTVKGDETGRIIDKFYENWERAGGVTPAVKPTIEPAMGGRARVQSFVTNPITGVHALQDAQLKLIANAQSEIVVMYPYFSDDKLVQALIDAKTKNPKLSIKVMLPANREVTAEGGVYQALNKESARQMMKVGIEVRMFAGGQVNGRTVERFSHFKGMSVDGKVLSLGSGNGDARTFHNNHELNTVIADPKAAKQFKAEVTDPDWAAATPLTQADLKADSFLQRCKQTVLEWLDFLL